MRGRTEPVNQEFLFRQERGDVVESTVSIVSRYSGVVIMISACIFIVGLVLKILN